MKSNDFKMEIGPREGSEQYRRLYELSSDWIAFDESGFFLFLGMEKGEVMLLGEDGDIRYAHPLYSMKAISLMDFCHLKDINPDEIESYFKTKPNDLSYKKGHD